MRFWQIGLAAASIAWAGSAGAVDTNSCRAGLVCASAPASVTSALQARGNKVETQTDTDGDPMLLVTTLDGLNTYNIYFYGCSAGRSCDSLMFRTTADPHRAYSADLVNLWNNNERFSSSFVNSSGEFAIEHDLSTVAGVSRAVFNDTAQRFEGNIDLMAQMLAKVTTAN